MIISRWAALSASAVLFLTGCTDGSEPRVGDVPTITAPSDEIAIDCAQSSTVTVRVSGGEVFAEEEAVSVTQGAPLRLVMDTDSETRVVLSGSAAGEFVASVGVSALCTTYPSTGRYAVEVGDVIAVFVDVVADAATSGAESDTASAVETPQTPGTVSVVNK